jgi:hypothetical protein
MSKLVLLFMTMVLGILFLAFPYSEETKDYFLLSDQRLTFQTHIWFICNRLIFVVFAYVIANESAMYRDALRVFFWIQVLKFFDYLLCYNEVWLRLYGIPFSSNTLGMLIFGLAIAYEFIWRKQE